MAVLATEQHEFAVTGAPRIYLRNTAGNVTIRAGAAGQVAVTVTKRARNGIFGTADAGDLERLRVDARQENDTISIVTEPHDFSFWRKSYTVDVEVVTPAATDLDLHVNAGNVRVEGVEGICHAKLNAGNLDTIGVTFGDRSDLSLNAGNLTLEGALAAGASLSAAVNAGNARLRLPHATAVFLDARTHAGNVDVSGWPVNSRRTFASASASGALGEGASGTLAVKVDAGNITLTAM